MQGNLHEGIFHFQIIMFLLMNSFKRLYSHCFDDDASLSEAKLREHVLQAGASRSRACDRRFALPS